MFEPKQVKSSEHALEQEGLRGYMMASKEAIIDTVNEFTRKHGEPTEGYYWINDTGQVFLYLRGRE